MEPYYYYSFVSFVVGALSGFQSIAEKFRKSRSKAVWTWAGLTYICLRGTVSASVFLALYLSSLYWSSVVYQKPLLWAIVCGTGAEYFLRSKVFVHEKKSAAGRIEEVMLGPLTLLLFFQKLFLDIVDEKLTPIEKKQKIAQAKARINFIRSNLPRASFEEVCQMVFRNLGAFDKDSLEMVDKVRKEVLKLQQEYRVELQPGGKSSTYDDEFKHKLGYVLLDSLGEEGFSTLTLGVDRKL